MKKTFFAVLAGMCVSMAAAQAASALDYQLNTYYYPRFYEIVTPDRAYPSLTVTRCTGVTSAADGGFYATILTAGGWTGTIRFATQPIWLSGALSARGIAVMRGVFEGFRDSEGRIARLVITGLGQSYLYSPSYYSTNTTEIEVVPTEPNLATRPYPYDGLRGGVLVSLKVSGQNYWLCELVERAPSGSLHEYRIANEGMSFGWYLAPLPTPTAARFLGNVVRWGGAFMRSSCYLTSQQLMLAGDFRLIYQDPGEISAR